MARPLTVTDAPSGKDIAFLDARLYEFNVAATGIDDGRRLAAFVRDDAGQIIAGLSGWTWGGCAYVDKLWVHEAQRGQGLGTALMRAAEAEARARGASHILLRTHSFQAPEFYARLGFERLDAVDDYPRGHQDITMRKTLGSET